MARKVAKSYWPGLALCLLTSFFAPRSTVSEVAIPDTPSPRFSDAALTQSRQLPAALSSAANVQKSVEFAPGADVTPLAIDFDHHALTRLIEKGQLVLDHPEGGDLVVSLVSQQTVNGVRTLAVRSDGYPGTITARGNNFFATLATHRGVYAIEHRHGTSQLIDHRQLDLRITRPDYQHVPTA
jgi:hypothetical protein